MPKFKSTPPVIRLAHAMSFSAFLRHVGVPVDHYFRRNRLPMLCDDPNAFVPLSRVWSFFDDTARHEDPMLGWLVGAYFGYHKLNAGLSRKLETAPTLLRALQEIVRLISSEASDLQLGIHERQSDVLFFTHYSDLRQVPGYMISQTYQLSVYLELLQFFLGPDWLPTEIGLEAPIVPPTLEERLPGSRILAQQPVGYIAVPRCCLHRAARRTALTGAGEHDLPLSKEFDYVDTLCAMLKSYLSEGYPSQRFAAELMNTTVRTLTRSLSAHGLTYGVLIDELRFRVAKDYLQNPDMRILDVAQSVGFKDQGDFTRMFRRIGGLTPGEFRNALQS